MSRAAAELLAAMEDVFHGMQARQVGERTFGRELMSLLEVRDLAREGQVMARRLRPRSAADRAAWQQFRIAMTLLEIRIHELLAAQPTATPEEDQELMDLVAETFNEVGAMAEQILILEDPAESPTAT